ncbi:hypothetical protein NEHOM01_2041 [Nematocida homosporus]|uniref:uncharacterized protein n=1 Tax=Nematocida homosporus TaxID=1912981 RepID=UPI00221E98CD|nr:uncharacterized protein NEHOM01_2041 [Nematocida homosporus]KAI5187245.1 hypothetical protein NEHOM01_2041 [Nematocida homosporus]
MFAYHSKRSLVLSLISLGFIIATQTSALLSDGKPTAMSWQQLFDVNAHGMTKLGSDTQALSTMKTNPHLSATRQASIQVLHNYFTHGDNKAITILDVGVTKIREDLSKHQATPPALLSECSHVNLVFWREEPNVSASSPLDNVLQTVPELEEVLYWVYLYFPLAIQIILTNVNPSQSIAQVYLKPASPLVPRLPNSSLAAAVEYKITALTARQALCFTGGALMKPKLTITLDRINPTNSA